MIHIYIYITITLCSGYACRVASKCLTLHCLLVFALYYKHMMNVGFFVGSCVCPTPSITNSQSAAPIIGPSMPHCSTNLPHLLGGVIYPYSYFFNKVSQQSHGYMGCCHTTGRPDPGDQQRRVGMGQQPTKLWTLAELGGGDKGSHEPVPQTIHD